MRFIIILLFYLFFCPVLLFAETEYHTEDSVFTCKQIDSLLTIHLDEMQKRLFEKQTFEMTGIISDETQKIFQNYIDHENLLATIVIGIISVIFALYSIFVPVWVSKKDKKEFEEKIKKVEDSKKEFKEVLLKNIKAAKEDIGGNMSKNKDELNNRIKTLEDKIKKIEDIISR